MAADDDEPISSTATARIDVSTHQRLTAFPPEQRYHEARAIIFETTSELLKERPNGHLIKVMAAALESLPIRYRRVAVASLVVNSIDRS